MNKKDAPIDKSQITQTLQTILKSQYRAALATLRQTIERCPETIWFDTKHTNAFWQVAYHTLFFAHLYMLPNEAAYQPWKGHVKDAQYPDCIPGPPIEGSDLPLLPEPYTKTQALEYCTFCEEQIDLVIDSIDLYSEESGFYWYKVPKLEHLIINLRHIQHGAAQLADRLRNEKDIATDWFGARRPKK